jgi:hypothetical protein
VVMQILITEYHFCCTHCGSDELKVLDIVPSYTEVLEVTSDAQIEYGETEHDFDSIIDSYFVCGGCRRELVIDDEQISSSDPCTLLKWFREKNGTPKEEVLQE